MRRIKTPQSQGRDYEKILKDYFGKFLYGLDVTQDGGQVQAQIIYFDFKHIDTVRRELAQMMPEVQFTKLKRDFTAAAETWALHNMIMPDYKHEPVIYVQKGEALVKSTVRDIARADLIQLELEDGDIDYTGDFDITCCRPELLKEHALD